MFKKGWNRQGRTAIALVALLLIVIVGTINADSGIKAFHGLNISPAKTVNENQFDFQYSGETELFVVPKSGIYTIETWGAQGGQSNNQYPGGKGGFASGELYLTEGEEIYVTVGGYGDHLTKGFNGGGKSAHSGNATYGGGATDIRAGGRGLYNRILVAGGGGASSEINIGGAGGGVNGMDGSGNAHYEGKGASQNSSSGNVTGSFGLGGNGRRDSSGYNGGGAGGGGWYGGGGGYDYYSYGTSGGGGSGYIYSSTSYKPANYNPDSKYHFNKAIIIAGNESFFSPDGKRVIGHEGNGYARLTLSDDNVSSEANLKDIRINGVSIPNFKEDVYNYDIEIDEIEDFNREITVVKKHNSQKVDGAGEIKIPHGSRTHVLRVYSADGKSSKDYVLNFKRKPSTKLYSLNFNSYNYKDEVLFEAEKYEYDLNVFQYTDIIPKHIPYDENVEVSIKGLDTLKKGLNEVKVIVKKRDIPSTTYKINMNVSYSIDFEHKQREQQFVVPHTGKYKLDVWGAQGGQRNNQYPGGKGGFSSGVVNLTKDEIVYLYLGGQGNDLNKGFNGGGKSAHNGEETYGGGATDIRVGGNGLYNRILVAGGGGASSVKYLGGNGGGTNGFHGSGNAHYEGKGASQNSSSGNVSGSFGLGGNGRRDSAGYNAGGGAGGGGWYGGGGGYDYYSYSTSGGGGSGYILTDKSHKPSGYNPDSKYYMTHVNDGSIGNHDLNTWKQSFIDVDGKRVEGHEGDGHARLTFLSDAFKASPELQNIYIDGVALENFDPKKSMYTIEIDGDYVGTKEIVVQKSLESQVVVGLGDIDLTDGDYSHHILVVSEDKEQTKTYVLNFVRKSTSYLKSLNVKGFFYNDEVEFEPDQFEYELDVFLDDAIEIEYTPFTQDTKVTIEGLDVLTVGKNEVKVTSTNKLGESSTYTIIINRKSSLDYSFKGRQQIVEVPYDGYYKLDTWGAQGGQRNDEYPGGKGGYSSGVVYLNQGDTLYLYVGGRGNDANKGFNGGGKSAHNGEETYGGGATDIRVGGNGLYNRILVAGGGGASSVKHLGGVGGGVNGTDGGGHASYQGKGASQTSSSGNVSGSFGLGGNGRRDSAGYNAGGGAGGGGWYGGGGGYDYYSYSTSGGGGSGYILTDKSHKPAGYNPDSKYYMTHVNDGSLGDHDLNTWKQSFIDVDGKRVEGHEADGHVRITYYSDSVKNSTEVNSIAINGKKIKNFDPKLREYTLEIDGEYVGEQEIIIDKRHVHQNIVGENIIKLTHHNVKKVFTVISADKSKEDTYTINFVRKPSTKLFDLSIDEYKHSFTENFKYNKYTYHLASYVYGGVDVHYKTFDENAKVTVQGAKDSELRPGNNKIIVTVSREGLQDSVYEINAYRQRDLEFSYSGAIEKFKIPYTGIYKFELWGAQGGQRNEENEGGRGGYAAGELYLKKDELAYINVGGRGNAEHKGYNGGGKSAHDGEASYGGGATDIRFGGVGHYNRVMVAGGGGASSEKNIGGAGGGVNGMDGSGNARYEGKGASQSSSSGNVTGSFGLGGNGRRDSAGYNAGGGAGGGGWYGGGGAYEYHSSYGTSGGGGSGYVYTQNSHRPAHYAPSVKYFASNEVLIDGTQEMPGKEGHTVVGNEGDGFVRISLLNLYGTDARLKYLEVSHGELNRSFDPEIYDYDLILDADQTELVINADTFDHNAFVAWKNDTVLTINPGITKFDLLVTAQDGSTQTYVLRVHRPASTTSELKDLSINGKTLEGFDPQKLEYTISLPYDALRKASLDWKSARPAQVISGNKEVVFENNKSEIISVISEDGKSVSEYVITAVIEDSNLLNELSIKEIALEFEPEVFDYEFSVPLAVSSLEITAIPYDHEATVEITSGGYLRVGSNTVTITVHEPHLESQSYTLEVTRSESADGSVDTEYDFISTGETQYFEAPYTGNFKLEAWGAEGGNRGNALGGMGGYSTGIVHLKQGEIIAIEVGGAGNKELKGYNGGGVSGTAGVYGGGASDVRVGSYGLYDRILVAGGGGSVGAPSRRGSAGGGLSGISSNQNYGAGGQGGSQKEAGLYGEFGLGGNGLYQYGGRGGAGGGGWFGGGGVRPDRSGDDDRGGGGGSGYVFTEDSYKPEGYQVDKKYYLSDASSIAGNAQIPGKDGGYVVGNSGNGFVRVTALRRASTDNYLSDILVNKGAKLSPDFDIEITDYSIHLDVNHTSLDVKGIVADPYAQISGNGSYLIPSEGKVIELTVTAEDGSIRIYTINVTRDASNQALPQNIEITGLIPSLCELSDEYCKFLPKFDVNGTVENGTGVYSLIVPSRIQSIEFSVIKSHEFQTVVGGGVVELNPGSDNTVYIEVESEDGSAHASYIFNIDRDMTGNADLGKLEMISPQRDLEFQTDITEYYVSIPNEYKHTDDLELEIETMDPNASFSIEGEGELELGSNVYRIIVKANNGLTKTYTLNIYREHNSNTFLKKLIVTHNDEALRIAPSFNKTIHDYLLTVENEVDEIKLIATAEEEATTEVNVPEDGIYKLEVGSNEINVLVTAEDGSSSLYRISIIRKESNNAFIKNITIDDQILDAFDPSLSNQTIEVDSQLTDPIIKVNLESEGASYVLSGSYTRFRKGSNFVYIRVTAENGFVKTYTIEFVKAVSADTTLSSIESNMFDITSRFDKDVDTYDINIPYSEEQLLLKAIPTHHTSKVNGDGSYYLSSGMNVIKIDVLAEDGSVGTYTLNINMLRNSNANLENIALNHGVLEPDFNGSITEYAVNVPNDVRVLDVNAIPVIKSTEVVGSGTHILETGLNVIEIDTRSESGKRMTYKLKVTRDVSSNADLSYLIVHEGALHREFVPNVIEYDVRVPHGTRRLTIEASVQDPFASYTILNANNLKEGINTVIVRVTPQDGIGVKDYTLNVFVQGPASSDNNLINLKVNRGTLKPDFLPIRQFYRVEVENNIDEIVVSAKAPENISLSGTGTHKLKVGRNLLLVRTKAANGVTKDYQIEVNRKPSSDASLRLMTLSKIESSYTFRPDRYAYSVSTRHTSIGINAIANHDKAKVEIIGNENFVTHSKSVVIIRVTAEDGISTQDYTVTVSKYASQDNNLASLSISGVHIEPEFRPARTTYKAKVTEDVRQVIVTAKPSDPNAKLEYTVRQNLEIGKNLIDIVVVSESGSRRKYTVEIEREGSRNRNLASIIVDHEKIEDFDKDKLSYQFEYEYEKESIHIDAVLEDDKASVTGIGEIALKVGPNSIPITVTSENGDIKTYTLEVTRKEINSALLETLNVENYPFETEFSSDIYNYNLVIDNEFDKLNLEIRARDPKAHIEVKGNSNLTVGNNKIEIIVTSSKKDKTQTYTLNVYKQEYGNNFLAYLSVDQGTLVPSFYRGTMVYNLELSHEIDTINIHAEADAPSAIIENLGKHELEYGVNRIEIPVRAHNGVQRKYYIMVNRSRSHDNYLSSLQVQANGENLLFSPAFDPKVNSYTLNEDVKAGTEFVNIIARSNASNIKGDKQQEIKLGKNKLEVIVTSDSGRENIYEINLNRAPSSNNNLVNIIPSSGKLSPNFNYTEDTYTVYADSATTSLAFDVVTEDKNAKVTGHEREIVEVGDTVREIKVTAETGDVKVYTIHVKKNETNNALLKTLRFENYEIEPAFESGVFTYTVDVPNDKTVVRRSEFTYEPWDKNATIETTGTLNLRTGKAPNVYEFRVNAVDGFTTETYRILINRASSSDSSIEELSFNKGILNKKFNSHVYDYDLEFDSDTQSFNKNNIAKLVTKDKNAKVSYSHDDDIELVEGVVVPFIITVTSEDGSNVSKYTFNITYTRSKDNKLSSIEIEGAVFKPEFDPEVLEYDISVHEDVSEVIVRAFTRDPKAKVISMLGETELVNHTTYLEIKVEAENKSIAIYKLNIKRNLSHSLDLKDIQLSDAQGALLNPPFDNFLNAYEATVKPEVDRVALVITKGHESQDFTLYDKFNNVVNLKDIKLDKGRNIFKLKVFSPFGDERWINFLIKRDGNSNNYLRTLEVSDPDFELNFDKDKLEYFIEIPNNYESIKINAVAEEERSKVDILRNNDLNVGNNDVIVRVTAENGDVRNYVIHVYKKGLYNNVLQTITVSVDGKVISENPDFFTPHFYKGITSYTVKVNSNVELLTVEGVPEENSTIVIGEAKHIVERTERGVQIELDPGNNIVKLLSQDPIEGHVLIYTVNIVREMSGDANLNGLEVFDQDKLLAFNEGEFNPDRNFYSLEIESHVTSLNVVASASNPQARVTITGNKNLLNGENLIKVTVTSEDRKHMKVYSILVKKNLSSEKDLDMLSIYYENSEPYNFDLEKEEFNYTVPSEVDKIYLEGQSKDPLAKISNLGEHAVDFGKNVIKVKVTAQDGSEKEYTVNVFRSYNLELESLKLNFGELQPEFDSKVFDYQVNVPLDIERINITAAAKFANYVEVSGNGWHDLNVGKNNLEIKATAPDGSEQITKLSVVRSASSNTNIANLDIEQGRISPSFDPKHYNYDTYIKDNHTKIDLMIELEDKKASFEILNLEDVKISNEKVTISNIIEENIQVVIRVTAENGDTQDTYLNVHRQPAALFSNLLASLEVSPIKSMSPSFKPTTNNYIAIVDEEITSITIKASKQSVDAEILSGVGTFEVKPGRNVYNIVVRSKDGVDNVYKVIINQAVSSDASLSELSFEEGYLTPVFSRGRKEYRMNVSANTDFLTPHIKPFANGTTWKITGGGFTEDLVMGENTVTIDTTAANGIGKDQYTVIVNKTNQTSVYLKSLSSNTGTFVEPFNKLDEGPYTLEIDAKTQSIMLSGVAEEPSSVDRIEGLGVIDVSDSNNKTVEITVYGKSGNKMSYYVNIVKKLNDDVKLIYLDVNPGTLNPKFNPDITSYHVKLDNEIEQIEILAKASQGAQIEGTGVKALKPGLNEFQVVITTDLGSVGVYTIVVEREINHSARILDLRFNEALIESPIFDKDEENYQLYVPYEITSLSIRDIVLEDEENAEYDLVQKPFIVGNNVVKIHVENKKTNETKTYTFNVTRYSFSSNFLKELYTDQGLLTPLFEKEHNYYEIDVPYDVTEIELIGSKEDGTASEVGLGIHRDLKLGVNELKVVVTSSNGVPRTYIVRVNRLKDSRNKLLNLDVIGGTLSPKFNDSEFNEYTVNVDADVDEITFVGEIPETASAKGLETLKITGPNQEHAIVVTAQDGSQTKYKFKIIKQLSSDAEVLNIIPSSSSLEPQFQQDTTGYTVTVEDDVNKIGFEVITSNKFAKVKGHEEKQIKYGENTFIIEVESEDGKNSSQYEITVIRLREIHGLKIDPDNIILNINDVKELNLIITPEDASDVGITWKSDNEEAVTVDEHGVITAVNIGSAQITAVYTKNPSITASASVEVLNLSLESKSLEIVRDGLKDTDIKDYVIGAPDKLSINDFMDLFENERSTLKVYDAENKEIEDLDTFTATGMTIRLVINDHIYDELKISVRADLDGDGKITISDFLTIQDFLLEKIEFTELESITADLDRDGKITITDFLTVQDFLLQRIDNVNREEN